VFTKAWQMLLRPIPSLYSLLEKLASKVKGLLEGEVAFALEDVDRVVGDSFGFSLEIVNTWINGNCFD
jgi:hypothetical protein